LSMLVPDATSFAEWKRKISIYDSFVRKRKLINEEYISLGCRLIEKGKKALYF